MKKLFLLLVFTGLIFVACDKEILPETFDFGLEEDFQMGEDYQSADHSLRFAITEINDSRCPSDVVCVWQGEAVVKIEVESPQSGSIELSTFDNLIDTLGYYSFELVEQGHIDLGEWNVEDGNLTTSTSSIHIYTFSFSDNDATLTLTDVSTLEVSVLSKQ